VKWRFFPLRDDVAAGILKQTGHRAVIAEFLTPQAAKNLRLRERRKIFEAQA
jgi:hypothetical protein